VATTTRQVWYKGLDRGELPEGRVQPKTLGVHTVCMTHFEGQYAALSNKCPHQGGPLGEGSIENGMLRCPWHGWDYHPITGSPPEGYGDCVPAFPVEIRDDGIYVGLAEDAPYETTVTDVMAETLTNWGVRNVFGMVGHSNLGLADALRRQSAAGRLRYVGIRHEGAAAFACSAYGKLTGRPAACMSIAGPGATNLLTGLWDANVDRAPVIALTGQVDTQVLGPGAFQEVDLAAAFGKVAQWTQPVLHTSKHAELAVLMSGYLGSIGFALPAAMGAWVATREDDPRFRDRKVISVSGDGGFGQYMGELLTAVKYGMNITDVPLRNDQLGKISKEQRTGDWEVWETDLHNPRFADYAELCGAKGFLVQTPRELDAALREAIGHPGASLVEIVADPELI
jgi:thiamine pyrophosphate-dependent acetolactate synthase large subunit-like protein/nitrite reductase/ring-hydroxylating ferredoxin subunit